MKTKEKSTTKALSVIMLSLLLVVSFILGATVAWFTTKSSLDDEINFGTLVINATNLEAKLVLRAENTNTLVPGDDFTVKYNVENTGTEDAYAVAYLSLEATDEDGNKIDAPIKHNLFLLQNYDLTDTNTTYEKPTTPSELLAGSANKKSNLTIKTALDKELGNDLQGANVKAKLIIYAIQKRNLEPADAMTELNKLIEADYPTTVAMVSANGTETTYTSALEVFEAVSSMGESSNPIVMLYEE